MERAKAGTNRVKAVKGAPGGSCPFISSGDGGAAYRPQDAEVVLFIHFRDYFIAQVPHSVSSLSRPCSDGFPKDHDNRLGAIQAVSPLPSVAVYHVNLALESSLGTSNKSKIIRVHGGPQ